jgi:putative molybdopterin biosynthesis protein
MSDVYLHDIPLEEAQQRMEKALRDAGRLGVLGIEEIPLDEHALGRVLAEPVQALISSPHYHASAMDGFAVRAEDTEDAELNNPVVLKVRPPLGAQDVQEPPAADGKEEAGWAYYVDTGDPVPLWADAVIPIENVEPLDEQGGISAQARRPAAIRIRAAVPPWSHIRPIGEDMVATQLVLPAGHKLRPVDLGAIAGCGHSTVRVAKRPRVAILPTGTELVPVGQPVRPGDIIVYKSLVLAAQVISWGGQADRFPITPDVFEQIRDRVAEAARDHDLVLLNAGSSAGSEDFSARVVSSLGELLVHGVAVRPGHPVILGMIHSPCDGDPQRKVPVIGVPGYPVSAALTAEIFVQPLLARWLGLPEQEDETVVAQLTRKVTSPAGDVDYLRVAVGQVGDKLLAAPLSRGSGVITSLVRADGIAILPAGVQGLPAGAPVEVHLYRSRADLKRTIFAIGSHDITLDLMAQRLAVHGRRLASANVGSQGGLVALRRGEAHLAGSHLLDPESGEYNLTYIRQYLPDTPVRVVSLVGREQGLLVPRGNPKGIRSIEDLVRPDVTFVNRQRGAGTRVLLDYHLGLLGMDPRQVRGYEREEYTHLAVAAAVSSGRADTGLGIAAAAQALDLDFVPLFQERYDLVIPVEYYSSDLLAPLLELLHDPEFREAVAALPGYDVSQMGNVVV